MKQFEAILLDLNFQSPKKQKNMTKVKKLKARLLKLKNLHRQYVVIVKLTVKILSIFVAFFENMNFKILQLKLTL